MSWAGASGLSASDTLSETETIPLDFTTSGKLMPTTLKWTHDGFYRLARYASVFYKLDSQDPTVPPIALSIPGASFTFVQDFDVTPGRTVIAAGFAESDGRRAHFIAIIPQNGPTRVIRTTPYWPFLLTVAPDGSIWTTGAEERYDESGHAIGTNPDAAVLRHFDPSGVLIGASETERTAPRSALSSGFLVATSRGVAWYGPKDGPAQYFMEWSSDSQTMTRYAGITSSISSLPRGGSAPSNEEHATGFSVTDAGKALLSTTIANSNGDVITHNLYAFDRTSQTWRKLSLPTTALSTLFGSRGESLVFRAKGTAGPALKLFTYSEH
jgi:hypothetical protein